MATGGDSSVDGGAGSDIIIGGTGNNPLNGNIDSDFLIGDLLLSEYFLGNDTLEGGPGNDLIEGGNGVDTFVFSPLDGSDIIAKFNIDFGQINKSTPVGKDFEPGTDKVNLISFGFTSFEEVMSKFSSNTEGHAQFSYQENTILFYGVTIDQLSVADFILV